MRKAIIISTVFILLVISALVFATNNRRSSDSEGTLSSEQTNQQDKDRLLPRKSSASDNNPGTYVAYSEDALARAKGQKVLFFHAPWCPQCNSIEKSILKDKNSIPSGITILKVDYDSSQKLRQRYGVTIQTTFVKIDDSGNLISKYVAYEEPNIESVKENFLL